DLRSGRAGKLLAEVDHLGPQVETVGPHTLFSELNGVIARPAGDIDHGFKRPPGVPLIQFEEEVYFSGDVAPKRNVVVASALADFVVLRHVSPDYPRHPLGPSVSD